jgi:hypothetical protein
MGFLFALYASHCRGFAGHKCGDNEVRDASEVEIR